VQYKLKDAAKWLYSNRDQEEMIRQVAETAIREIVGRSKMDFVLYEGREKVALDVNMLMQQVLDRYDSGAQITNVTMQAVQPPEQVQAAFDDAVKAGQDKERQKNEGQAYANDVIPKARGEASRMLQDAEGYRSKVVANAEGNAARFRQVLVEYQKAPAVTRDRMYLETMQQIFSSTTKLMMDTKNANNMIYLPLDKLNSQGENGTRTSAPAVSNNTPTDTMTTVEVRGNKDGRIRDSRDRESR
jgi:membrane protease subunit HflK